MNSKSKFILSIVVLTVLFIGFLTGVFMISMFMVTQGVTTERIGILVINLGLSAIALTKLIRLNNKETELRRDSVVKGYHEFIEQWNIPREAWQKYHKAKLVFDIGEANSYGYISGGIVVVVFLISSGPTLEIENALLIAAAIFITIFLVIKLGVVRMARKRYRKSVRAGSGEVYFAKDLIIINGELIIVNEFGYQLKAFLKEERFGFEVLSFVVETGFGYRKNQRNYFIPIPKDNGGEADKLVNSYRGLVD